MAHLSVKEFSSDTTAFEFFEALKDHDDCYMNFPFGSFMDSIEERQLRVRDITGDSRVLVGVFDGDVLILALVNVVGDFAWVLGCPSSQELPEARAQEAISSLVSFLPSVIKAKSLDRLFGPQDLVDALIDKWTVDMTARGLHIEVPPPVFRSKASLATLATLPAPPPVLSKYRIELARSNDVETLASFYIDFLGVRHDRMSLQGAWASMDESIRLGDIWVCRDQGEIAGYTATGRTTARTVAIRNVYVSPEHRRKGIAEAMTAAVTRFYLGAQPLGFEGAPDGPPARGVKDEVCLNVVDDFVAKLYKKCGFLLGEDDRDPASGKKGWFATTLRAIRVADE
ncbi:GNAT family N-acetyltransferase [Phanerochaete sordida]|uniref:GNAT family N-acetyltransferase n=1 Tax=Phanerochaete sordida TaxID=48140 RepID=A0A9P3G394_9APHY|nr:GNAT family N-acetyltransferase [Phanerochaete sordida]